MPYPIGTIVRFLHPLQELNSTIWEVAEINWVDSEGVIVEEEQELFQYVLRFQELEPREFSFLPEYLEEVS